MNGDQSVNKEDVTQNKYWYHTSTNDTSNICILDSWSYIPVFYSQFHSNINDNSKPSSHPLIKEYFGGDDIDYTANIIYPNKQDIEKSSYISKEELITFYDCPKFEEYQDCNE